MISRTLVVLKIVLIVVLPSICSAGELQIRFIGNEAFEITDGVTTLLTDFPYRSGSFGYMEYDFNSIRPKGKLLCLITHGHADHFDPTLFQKTGCSIFAPKDVLEKIESTRTLPDKPDFRFNDIEIQSLETPHAKVGHYSYVVTWKGKRLYFTGDTESPDALVQTKKLDVAFVTPWLLSALREQGKDIDAKRIVIYHHAAGEKVDLCGKCRMLQQGQILSVAELLTQ